MQYNDSNSTWETYGNDITGSNFECMGWSLALNSAGNRLVIGSPWYNMDRTTHLDANIQNYIASGMGRVQVFELDGSAAASSFPPPKRLWKTDFVAFWAPSDNR